MPKKTYTEPVNLAPQITEYPTGEVFDFRAEKYLDRSNTDDKILIYERQVQEWFLNHAVKLSRLVDSDFVVVMIATSYIEGIEQYRKGISSDRKSEVFFRNSMRRIFGLSSITDQQLKDLYNHLRCGLFHNGMSGERIILNNEFDDVIDFSGSETIDINPKKFLDFIIKDFEDYIKDLKNLNEVELRDNFNKMFDEI